MGGIYNPFYKVGIRTSLPGSKTRDSPNQPLITTYPQLNTVGNPLIEPPSVQTRSIEAESVSLVGAVISAPRTTGLAGTKITVNVGWRVS